MKLTRSQVLGYRCRVQQLDRSGRTPTELAVLDIGVQDAAAEAARLAFDARLPATPPAELAGPGHDLALVWSLRGAPHLHRRGELNALAGALYPLSEADAAQRLNETGPSIARSAIAAVDQFSIARAAMRAAVRTPTAKGAVSTAVTQAVPAVMRRSCRPCGTSHISDSAMRASCLAAGLELQPGTAPPVLQRRARATEAKAPDLGALRDLVLAYLRLLGPATPVHVAGYLDARRADLQPAWPADLVEVEVDGARAWLPPDCTAAIDDDAPLGVVRLLGGFDPYLQARDRGLLVPDKAAQKALWPVLGRPGAVLVDGEIAGIWRAKSAGTKLSITVEAFGPLPPTVWAIIEDEAQRVAAVRGAESAALKRVG